MRGLKPGEKIIESMNVSRIFYRCVDWNMSYYCLINLNICRIFYRCVDWNIVIPNGVDRDLVASFTDAWIETLVRMGKLSQTPCRIFYRCVDWNVNMMIRTLLNQCRIFYRCVDWNKQLNEKNMSDKMSHLLQMRGLKLYACTITLIFYGRIFYRCVDWNISKGLLGNGWWSHLLQMRGLKL